MQSCVLSVGLLLLTTVCSIEARILDDLHCKLATCGHFQYGLKSHPRAQEYLDICYETVASLQMIPRKYGKCLEESTMKLNPTCIRALASTIQNCIRQLHDLSNQTARYYCGYTLMKHCAVRVGLERFRLDFQVYPGNDSPRNLF